MNTQTQKFWIKMPEEDISFYRELAASAVASLAIVFLV